MSMEYLRLSDCAYFSTQRTKNISIENYISTENMLPNKGGITIASSLPETASASKYEVNDILLSNIRPYFKKIWLANKQGSCSNDVLVLKSKENYSPLFLYYVLSDNNYFNYATVTAKGTKMPRGTPKAILKYFVPNVSLAKQQKIASILSVYDDLIENNNKRIKILEQMAENLYKEWFVRFRFPNYQNAEFENGIPKGWKVVRLGEYANISTGKCNREDAEEAGIYPLFDRSQEIKKSNSWIKNCEAIIIPGEGTSFMPRYYVGKFNLHQRCYCIEPKNKSTGKYIFYSLMLNRIYFLYVATGATVPSLRQNNFTSMKIIMPKMSLVKRFDEIISLLFEQINFLEKANEKLSKQRDMLLPRLMSGKLEVK